MRKGITTSLAVLTAIAITGCSAVTPAESNETTTAATTITTTAETTIEVTETEVTEETTQTNVAAVEGAPEETPPLEEEIEIELPETEVGEEIPVVEEFPEPVPSAGVINEELLAEFRGIVENAIAMDYLVEGHMEYIPLTGEVVESSEEGEYQAIDSEFAADEDALLTVVGAPFATYFWSDEKGDTLENLLTVDTLTGGILVKTVNGGLAYRCAEQEIEALEFDLDSLVILSVDEDEYYSDVCLVGHNSEGETYWRTYTMINGFRGWVVESFEDKAVTGEVYLFEQMLTENQPTLELIFGGAVPVLDAAGNQVEETIIVKDDPYGNGVYYGMEVEPFMTIQEMREFLQSIFIPDIADAYIALYINGVYVEQNDKLYISEGAVMPTLGTFDTASYQTQSYSTDRTFYRGFLDWNCGDLTSNVIVGLTRISGTWKISTRLPFGQDKVMRAVIGG